MDYAHCRPSKGLVEHPRRGFNIWIISMLTATLGVNFAESADPETVHRRHFVMGTWLDLRIEAPTRSGALAASESVLRTVEDAERRLSTWRDDSELTGLNQFRTGEWAELSASLARDLAEAARWERRSDGAFRPGIAMLVEMWDLRGQGRVPSPDELRIGVSASLPDGIEIVGRRTRRIRSDYRIEEGGFGKGAALVDTIEAVRFAAASCAVMDFGGQVFFVGESASRFQLRWRIPEIVRSRSPKSSWQRGRPRARETPSAESLSMASALAIFSIPEPVFPLLTGVR